MLKFLFLWIYTGLGLWEFSSNSFISGTFQHIFHFISRSLSFWHFITAFTRRWLNGVDVDDRFCWTGVAEEKLEVEQTTVIASSQNLPLLQDPSCYFLWMSSQADLHPHLQVFLSFLQFLNQLNRCCCSIFTKTIKCRSILPPSLCRPASKAFWYFCLNLFNFRCKLFCSEEIC